MRYYSTQRPVGPGTYPKPQGNAVKEVFNFDSKTYCEEVGRDMDCCWNCSRNPARKPRDLYQHRPAGGERP